MLRRLLALLHLFAARAALTAWWLAGHGSRVRQSRQKDRDDQPPLHAVHVTTQDLNRQ
jgi:hypothetical protein